MQNPTPDPHQDEHRVAVGAASATVNAVRKDDRLDAAFALFLAFAVLGSVVLYATKPWQGNEEKVWSGWLGSAPAASASVLPAPKEAAASEALPMVRASESDVSAVASVIPAASMSASSEVAQSIVAQASAAALPLVVSAPASVAAVVPAASVVEPAAVIPVVPALPVVEPVKALEPQVVIREQIEFESGKAVVARSAHARLNEIAQILAKDPRNLKIAGHTDDRGQRGVNVALSLRRAEAVRGYLVARGASADRLQAVGMGPDRPIGDNKTEEGRARNRRIEITE